MRHVIITIVAVRANYTTCWVTRNPKMGTRVLLDASGVHGFAPILICKRGTAYLDSWHGLGNDELDGTTC